jgi:drug/metabolite transporter (DMT)-like permease
MSVVPLRDMAFILPAVYVLVPLFSKIFLKERFGKQTIIGTLIMVVGIVIFNIPMNELF